MHSCEKKSTATQTQFHFCQGFCFWEVLGILLATEKAAGIGGGGAFFGLFVPGKLLLAEQWGFEEFFKLPIFQCLPFKGEKKKCPCKHQKKPCQKVEQKTSGASVSPPRPCRGQSSGGFVPSLWVTYQYLLFVQGDFTDALPWGQERALPVAVAGWGPHEGDKGMWAPQRGHGGTGGQGTCWEPP